MKKALTVKKEEFSFYRVGRTYRVKRFGKTVAVVHDGPSQTGFWLAQKMLEAMRRGGVQALSDFS